MSGWQLQFKLNEASTQPVYAQLADAIVSDIERGRLRPSQRILGSRALAEQIGVHRNTVLAAYDELLSQGWIITEAARGTYVSSELPEVGRVRREPEPGNYGNDLPLPFSPPSLDVGGAPAKTRYYLVGGLPDPRLFPVELLARSMRRVLRREGARLLNYGDARGALRLREALVEMLADLRGLSLAPTNILITRGSQMALWLVAQCLRAMPGRTVAVERYGYRPAWEALKQAGHRLISVPVDEHGIQTERLERIAASGNLCAVYVTPHHQFPTMVALSAERRLELLELSRRYRFLIIEDDYDHEYHYEGRPVLPLASHHHGGHVLYIGTLSKVLAPGLRVGYLVGPERLVEHAAGLRTTVDRQGDNIGESAIAELIEDGEIQRHIRRTRGEYQKRRDALAAALAERFGCKLSWQLPKGGMALWVKCDASVDIEAWAARAEARGVWFSPGRRYAFGKRRTPYARIGFAAANATELRAAVNILSECWQG